MAEMKPIHLALIPDGNRRWAREHGLPVEEGHRRGARVMERCLRWCLEEGVEEVSVYALSIENLLKRPQQEIRNLLLILRDYLDRLAEDDAVHRHEVRVRVLGKLYRLPAPVLRAAARVMRATRPYARHALNLLVAYGGRDELVHAFQLARRRGGRLTRPRLERFLWVARPVDLVIRTGRERRLSNFLLYQSAYAELAFVDKYWPEFTRADLRRCIRRFEQAQRRLGA